jgi:hypothetical protein
MTDPVLRSISQRLSLRPPQTASLGILADVLGRIALGKNADPAGALAAIVISIRRFRISSAISRRSVLRWQPGPERRG